MTRNYADEFNANGILIIKDTAWNDIKEGIPETGKLERYFGSNQSVTWNSKEDYLSGLKITEITQAEANFLAKCLGDTKFKGTFQYGAFLCPSENW